jgi:hypothetical protein
MPYVACLIGQELPGGALSLIVSPGTGDALDFNGFTLLVGFVNARNHGRGVTG